MSLIPDFPFNFLSYGIGLVCLLLLLALIRMGMAEIAEEKRQNLKVALHTECSIWQE